MPPGPSYKLVPSLCIIHSPPSLQVCLLTAIPTENPAFHSFQQQKTQCHSCTNIKTKRRGVVCKVQVYYGKINLNFSVLAAGLFDLSTCIIIISVLLLSLQFKLFFFVFSPNHRLLAVSLLDCTVKVFFADTLKVYGLASLCSGRQHRILHIFMHRALKQYCNTSIYCSQAVSIDSQGEVSFLSFHHSMK